MSRGKREVICGNVKTFDMNQIKKQIKESPTELQLYIKAKDRSITNWVDICNQAKAKIKEQSADYTKLQEERDKAVELLREVQQENKCNFFDCDCASCNAEKFLASIDKEKG